MHFESYIRSAQLIIDDYDGQVPFTSWLKQYFREYKKFGSRDRKFIARICYNWFRLGRAFEQLSFSERIITGEFLSNTLPTPLLEQLKPEWNQQTHLSLQEKLKFCGDENAWAKIFPFHEAISDKINAKAFATSHLQQPDLFLRTRPGKKQEVIRKLSRAGIDFREVDSDCLRLQNASPVDAVIRIDEDVVIQDYNSQRTLYQLHPHLGEVKTAWDCCAASGGKSLLLHDTQPSVYITASDIRQSIIHNLRSRFSRAGLNRYKSFVADLVAPGFNLKEKFDLVICDAPCSGSGTWGRTPEQLRFFKVEQADHYQHIQTSIIRNAHKQLNPGKYFLYITCSVFKKENEDVVAFAEKETPLKLISMEYLQGYDIKADSLFAALFQL